MKQLAMTLQYFVLFRNLMFLIYGINGFQFQCPQSSQWPTRAKAKCLNSTTYFCLQNDLVKGFTENCSRIDFDQPGKRIILRGGFDNGPCSKNLYQPREIIYWTNVSSDCIYHKSLCTGEGQVEYRDGGVNFDRTCACDYTKEFVFVTKPVNHCFCKPLKEDCTCMRCVKTTESQCLQSLREQQTQCLLNNSRGVSTPAAPTENVNHSLQEESAHRGRNKYMVIYTILGYIILLCILETIFICIWTTSCCYSHFIKCFNHQYKVDDMVTGRPTQGAYVGKKSIGGISTDPDHKLSTIETTEEVSIKEEIRIVLVGRTGAGKSASGNSILGKIVFKSTLSAKSTTTKCEKGEAERNGKKIVVVDTPGLFDTEKTNKDVITEMVKCIAMTLPGPHAMMFVLSIGDRFTKEEQDTVKHFINCFENSVYRFMVVLFTKKDELSKNNISIQQYLEDCPDELKNLVKDCGNRFVTFNNHATDHEKEEQLNDFFTVIEKMLNSNEEKCYTNEMYKFCEEEIDKRVKSEIGLEKIKFQRNVDDLLIEQYQFRRHLRNRFFLDPIYMEKMIAKGSELFIQRHKPEIGEK